MNPNTFLIHWADVPMEDAIISYNELIEADMDYLMIESLIQCNHDDWQEYASSFDDELIQ